MFQLKECTVKDIIAHFISGELTSYELTLMYLDRISKYDKSSPGINSVLEINPDALYIAQAMDRERSQGKIRSNLHGVPILLKDNINTKDKMSTSAGSIALSDNFATYDAFIVERIRKAGLVIIGKANMTELANFMSYDMKSGYSSRGGQVVNPYNPDSEVWGSSTGSAVAVSANFCAMAVGTETNGSIMAPSYINGSVGIKPTKGLVSRYGIIPISNSQDIAGPMTRTVADAAALLNVLVGIDENDPATWAQESNIESDYTKFLDADGLKGVRVGVNRVPYTGGKRPFTEDMIEIAENAFKVMNECGAVLVDDVNLGRIGKDMNVMLYEFKRCLNAYLATTSPSLKVRTLKDMIDYYGDHPKEGLKYGMGILLDAQYKASGNLTEPEYIDDRIICLELSQKQGLDKLFDEFNIDVLACPTWMDAAPVSGYPSICIPAGYRNDNTPQGLVLIGRPFTEGKLISAAYAYEQASKARKAPKF